MVGQAVARLDYVEGAPGEERRRTAAALEREREALVSEREGLVVKAQVAGIQIEQLPETTRRLASEENREREEREAAQRQAEAARTIDARHAGARSAYLGQKV
jgi:hypothetical protein